MSGKRAKRLRAEFEAQFGTWPKKTRMTGTVKKLKNGKTVGVALAHATYKETREEEVNGIFRKVIHVLRIMRPVFNVKVTSPSEWRHWKKAAGDRQAFQEMREPTVLHAKPGVILVHKMPERLAA